MAKYYEGRGGRGGKKESGSRKKKKRKKPSSTSTLFNQISCTEGREGKGRRRE